MSPRTGRPKIADPANIRFSVRLTKTTAERLEAYCREHQITKGKAVRMAIEQLINKK